MGSGQEYLHESVGGYSNSEYSVTMDAIRDKLIKTHGGYLQIRYKDGNRYLDYLPDFNTRSLQTVEFGKNLLDMKVTRDHTARASVLIPLGAIIEESSEEESEETSQKRVDITSVNEGRNYIYDEDAVAEIGWIWATEIWDDVTVPGNLLRKGNARLPMLQCKGEGCDLRCGSPMRSIQSLFSR